MSLKLVAEVSANHLGQFDRALRIIDAAAAAGATHVKLQTWALDTMCLTDYTLDKGPWAGRKLADLYREAYTPWEWHEDLFTYARHIGLTPFSTPFDRESVDFLEGLDCPIYKISSFELVDIPLIKYVASKGKPMVMSLGMATIPEIIAAYSASSACADRTFLKCTSAYPADIADANLATIPDLRGWLGVGVGLSDHSPGHAVAAAAVALGATVVEKHLTLSRADGGPDAGFSLEPQEFAEMVKACREAEKARGEPSYGPAEGESTALRRSVYIAKDLKAGDAIAEDNIRTARPALGIQPSAIPQVIGRRLRHDAAYGTPLTMDLLT